MDKTLFSMSLLIIFLTTSESCTKDAKEIGNCLHTYLERYFTSIEMIVYPSSGKRNYDDNQPNTGGKFYIEGPKLEGDCKHLKGVLECFTGILERCFYMEDFFRYRRLIDSLEKTHEWLCGDITSIRERFVVLLKSVECMEWAQKHRCSSPVVQDNVWNRILRLEDDTALCRELIKQGECLVEDEIIGNRCGPKAQDVYANMTEVFLANWCSTGEASYHAPSIKLLSFLVFTRVFMLEL